MEKKNYLNPVCGINRQKSFYRKAFVEVDEHGNEYLTSYDTVVAVWLAYTDTFYKTWNGYSRTTLEHVKAFFGRNISKKEWNEMEILDLDTFEVTPTDTETQYTVYATNGFFTYKSDAKFNSEEEASRILETFNTRPGCCAWVE